MYKSLFIDGQWQGTETGLDDVNPSDTHDVIGRFATASQAQIRDAVAAARRAAPAWARTTTQLRSDILAKAAAEVLARREELGQLVSREAGKTRAEGIGEVTRAGQVLNFFAGEALRYGGENLPSVRPDIGVQISRDAVGVVSVITPWNFPIAIPAWKIGPALAFGNTVVFKPSELTPAVACELVAILARSGLPNGVLNLVIAEGRHVGDSLVEGVDAISFTGSVVTGRGIARQAVERMARVQLEMGGKNPLVVLDDADLPTAVECAVNGAFFSAGQRCTASSRLIVTAGIHDRFVEALQQRLARLTVGPALDDKVDIGPLISAAQLEKNLEYIRLGQQEGARLVAGGQRLECRTPGHFLSPALFVDSRNDMRINREEIFGPVAAVIRAQGYEEALALANDTDFGLSSGICTTSHRYANHFRLNVKSGLTMINLPTAGLDYHVPFGGTKGSSYGPREQGRYAVEFYTVSKTAYVGY